MLAQQNIIGDQCFFPICQEKRCGGILSIKYSENDSEIIYQCEKNNNHNGELYFKTLERFYLNTKIFEKCSKCSINLGNNSEYKCIKCHQFYCVNCYKTDIHIKNDINNLNTNFKICPIHYNKLIDYCVDCGKEICIFCLKKNKENNPHTRHSIKYILNMMPSLEEINSLNQKIKEKSKAYKDLIVSLDIWLKRVNKKIELLKENLKNEIYVLEKLFNNYNQDYINYTHFNNFIYFYENLKIFNNDNLDKCSKSIKFEEQTKSLLELLCNQNLENKENTGMLIKIEKFNPYFISQITDNIIFISSNREAYLLTYKNNKYYIFKNGKIFFESKITSISCSNKTNKIYACLSSKKVIKIFDYNIKEESLKLSKEEIIGKEYFNKCIPLYDNSLITADDEAICLWSKNNSKNYMIKNKIKLTSKIFDLSLVSDMYIVFTRKDNIRFLNVSNFSFGKAIYNIEPINSDNGLVLIKDYIIVNCNGGIAIVSIKEKELVQYIQYSNDDNNRVICKINDNSICMLIINYYINITVVKLKLFEGEFIKIEKTLAKNVNDLQPNAHTEDVRICFINQRKIIIMGEDLFTIE